MNLKQIIRNVVVSGALFSGLTGCATQRAPIEQDYARLYQATEGATEEQRVEAFQKIVLTEDEAKALVMYMVNQPGILAAAAAEIGAPEGLIRAGLSIKLATSSMEEILNEPGAHLSIEHLGPMVRNLIADRSSSSFEELIEEYDIDPALKTITPQMLSDAGIDVERRWGFMTNHLVSEQSKTDEHQR